LNYRPISIPSSISKDLENALYNRLIEYLNKTNLLKAQQFGFKKRYSTEDAIFKLTREILNALNSQTLVGSIFFDMTKAFD